MKRTIAGLGKRRFLPHNVRETEAVVFNTLGRIWLPIEEPPDSIEQYFHDWLDRNGQSN